MSSRVYPVFLPATSGTDMEVLRGGVAISTITSGLNINRTARLTVAAQDFDSAAEFILYGKAGTIITNKVSIGVVTEDASLSTYVGGDAEGIGYRVKEGQIHNAGASIETVTAGVLGDVIGVLYRASEQDVSFFLHGVPVGTVSLPSEMTGVPLYLAVSIGSDVEAGDIQVQVNPGRYWYEYDVYGAEWWDAPTVPGTLRFSEEPFISAGTDTPPYVRWEGGITAERIQDDRGVHFWIWGNSSQARGSAAVIDVIDSLGRMDGALGGVYRDQPAALQTTSTTLAAATSLGAYVVDKIESTGPMKRRITLKGPLAQFEIPMLQRQVRPDSDADSVGQFYPLLIGPAFSCPARLLTKANRMYAVDAIGVEVLGKVRDKGLALSIDPLDPDYVVHAGGQRVELMNEPGGTVTIDAGYTGGAYVPGGSTDILGGSGNPFVGSSGVGTFPTDWTLIHNEGPSPSPPFVNASGYLEFPHPDGNGNTVIQHDTAQLEVGKTYRIRMTIQYLWFHPTAPTSIFLQQSDAMGGLGVWKAYTLVIDPSAGISAGGVAYPPAPVSVTSVITPTYTSDLYLRVRTQATMLPPFTPTTAAIISSFSIQELPPPEDESEDDADAAVAGTALPLYDMMFQGIQIRCGLGYDLWDASSAQAIDTATGYAGQGYWAHEQVKLRDYLEALLAPYCASAFEASDGRLTVVRLTDPESETATGTISQSDYLNDPEPVWDDMPGLSCSIGCRRNEHVFSADELADALPYAARSKLTKQYRYERTYLGPLAPGLEHARAAETMDSRLVVPEDAQGAIDHIGQLASIPRAFFTLKVANPGRYEVGQIVSLDMPRWFSEGSRNVFITRIQNGRQDIGTITVWCRAPWG